MSVISSVVWPKLAKFVTKPRNDSLVSVILEGYLSCVSPDRYPKLNFVSSGAQGDYEFLQGLLLPVARPRLCNEFIQRTRNRRGLSVAVFSCCVPRELESLEGETVTFTNTADRSMESILIDETVKMVLVLKNNTYPICCFALLYTHEDFTRAHTPELPKSC